ncbi:hypothetical protein [Paenibacillus sp. L3-i20]|nr:hypothetical protein [Paenibacillus sp. L3-i20]
MEFYIDPYCEITTAVEAVAKRKKRHPMPVKTGLNVVFIRSILQLLSAT